MTKESEREYPGRGDGEERERDRKRERGRESAAITWNAIITMTCIYHKKYE